KTMPKPTSSISDSRRARSSIRNRELGCISLPSETSRHGSPTPSLLGRGSSRRSLAASWRAALRLGPRRAEGARAAFAAAGLAVGLGVGLGGLFLRHARGRGWAAVGLGRAGVLVEAELLHRSREVLGQLGGDVERAAAGRIDDQPTGVQVDRAADRTGQERVLPTVLAVADDRVADRRHVHAQLMSAAGQRLQLDPGGAVAGAVDHAVAGLRRLAVLHVDVHLLAAGARLLGERRIDRAVVDIGHADHQRPVDLLRRAARETLREERRAPWGARDEQDARGVLVEPVDEARARLVVAMVGVEQAVDMVEGAGAALGGEAGRLVEHERGLGLADDHRPGLLDLRRSQLAALRPGLAALAAGRHAHDLAGGEAVLGLDPLAVDADLPGARPTRDRGEADLRQVALEPPVEPNAVVVGLDGELADFARGFGVGHAASRMMIRPMYSAERPASTETAPYRKPWAAWPRSISVISSRLKAEKVVNPPSTPTPSSRRAGSPSPCRAKYPASSPIARLPRMLTVSVAHGNAETACGPSQCVIPRPTW